MSTTIWSRWWESNSLPWVCNPVPVQLAPPTYLWHPHEESNLDSQFRRLLYYPLYYGDKLGAGSRNRTSKPKRKILSLLCLPISPYPQKLYYTSNKLACQQLSGTSAQIRTENNFSFWERRLYQFVHRGIGATGRIRTYGFADLQSTALGLSATVA